MSLYLGVLVKVEKSSVVLTKLLQDHISAVDWSKLLSVSDVDALWDTFQATVTAAISACRVNMLQRSVYIRRKIRSLNLRKKRGWKRWKSRPTAYNKQRYTDAAKELSNAIQNSRKREEDTILRRSLPQFYRYVTI